MAITTHSQTQTHRLGRQLGALLRRGHVIFLTGELGAGKTTFAKGVALGLGVQEEVTSPTFTLIAEYEGRAPLAHMDLYRLWTSDGEASEAQPDAPQAEAQSGRLDSTVQVDFAAIGVQDYLYGDYVVLVEWPGHLVDEVDDALFIEIVPQPLPRIDEREFRCKATGDESWKLLDEWVKQWLF